MKKNAMLLTIGLIILSGCSSMPKDEKAQLVNTGRTQSALQLERGNNEYRWNNYASALNLYHKALASASAVDWQEGIIRCFVQISRTLDQMNRSEDAFQYIKMAYQLLEGMDCPVLQILVINRHSEWSLFQENPDEALSLIESAIKVGEKIISEEAGESWRIKAAVLKKMDRFDLALEAIQQAEQIDSKGPYLAELASDYYIMGSLFSVMENYTDAVKYMQKALEKDKFIENSAGIALDLYGLSRIYNKNGAKEMSVLYLKRLFLVYHYANRGTVPENLLNITDEQSDLTEWRSILRNTQN